MGRAERRLMHIYDSTRSRSQLAVLLFAVHSLGVAVDVTPAFPWNVISLVSCASSPVCVCSECNQLTYSLGRCPFYCVRTNECWTGINICRERIRMSSYVWRRSRARI